MSISASMVKELREKTGAGMMDCKKALQEAGNMEDALKLLREKGLARAAKKSDRVAAEGLIAVNITNDVASMVEVNCETDFVARNEDFKNLVREIVETASSFDPSSVSDPLHIEGEKLNSFKTNKDISIEALITENVATIGEKITLRRFAVLNEGDMYGAYLHTGGSIGTIVECKLEKSDLKDSNEVRQLARDLAMHVAASNPNFISQDDIPKEWVESEREIFRSQVLAEGKPENIVDKIVEGKLAKHKKDFCLLDQPFVKNPELTVKKYIEDTNKATGAGVKVHRIVRYKVGEGIEKKADDLREEVKKMTS